MIATDATNFSTGSPHGGLSKLLIQWPKMTGQRRPSFSDTTRSERVTIVVTATVKMVILGISNDAPLIYRSFCYTQEWGVFNDAVDLVVKTSW